MICEAEKYITRFEDFVRGYSTTEKADTERLLAAVQKINALPMDAFGSSANNYHGRVHAKSEALGKCVRQFVANRMSEEFPVLDPALFHFRRWIGVRFGDKPELFASVVNKPEAPPPKSPERWVETKLLVESQGRETATLGSIPFPGQRRTQCTLYAKFPGVIGEQQSRYGHLALAKLYRIHADLLSDPATALLARENIEAPRLSAYWIPSLESIYLREERAADRRDPALVLHVAGRRFLCCMWSAEGEQPLEAIMREFSEGGTVNTLEDDD